MSIFASKPPIRKLRRITINRFFVFASCVHLPALFLSSLARADFGGRCLSCFHSCSCWFQRSSSSFFLRVDFDKKTLPSLALTSAEPYSCPSRRSQPETFPNPFQVDTTLAACPCLSLCNPSPLSLVFLCERLYKYLTYTLRSVQPNNSIILLKWAKCSATSRTNEFCYPVFSRPYRN
jgi:hypothetical protein